MPFFRFFLLLYLVHGKSFFSCHSLLVRKVIYRKPITIYKSDDPQCDNPKLSWMKFSFELMPAAKCCWCDGFELSILLSIEYAFALPIKRLIRFKLKTKNHSWSERTSSYLWRIFYAVGLAVVLYCKWQPVDMFIWFSFVFIDNGAFNEPTAAVVTVKLLLNCF